MTENQKKEREYYTLTEVKELGFSPKMIAELLPEPILKTNPFYKSAAKMKWYPIAAVEEAMQSESFAAMSRAREGRKKGAAKAVETKRAKLHNEIQRCISGICVEKIDFSELLKRTLQAKQEWYELQADLRGDINDRNAFDADIPTQHRWAVNYIRHNLTLYDDDLWRMAGKVGCHAEYLNYKEAVLNRIADTYPELKKECRIQKERARGTERCE